MKHHPLTGKDLTLGYDGRDIARHLDVTIPSGQITAIVGANACGKSTVLRALARLLKPRAGTVLLDGRAIESMSTRDVATRVGILPQAPLAPSGITVADLVARGRYPHQRLVRQWSRADEAAVAAAMTVTDTLPLASRPVDELSGGQRQRVWIALALAQETDILLLDEPTTYLDLSHQIDVLDLLVDLNTKLGRTIVMVLHDLNHAARYAHHIIAMREGSIVANGEPADIITADLVHNVFGMRSQIITDPFSSTPVVIPIGRHAGPQRAPRDATQPATATTA